MTQWALIYFIVALLCAIFAFGGVTAVTSGTASVLFFLFLGLTIVTLVVRVLRDRGW